MVHSPQLRLRSSLLPGRASPLPLPPAPPLSTVCLLAFLRLIQQGSSEQKECSWRRGMPLGDAPPFSSQPKAHWTSPRPLHGTSDNQNANPSRPLPSPFVQYPPMNHPHPDSTKQHASASLAAAGHGCCSCCFTARQHPSAPPCKCEERMGDRKGHATGCEE